MNILLVSQFFYPEITAGAYRAFEHACLWAVKGNDVTVYTTYPNYPKGKIHSGYKNDLITVEKNKKVKVVRGKSIIKSNSKKFSRGLVSISFLIFACINMLINKKKIGEKFDVVIGSSGTIFAALVGYLFSKRLRVPFILELRDLTYVQLLGTLATNKSVVYKIMKKLEIYLSKKADRVVVTTDSFRKQLIKEGLDPKKIATIYNGVIVDKQEDSNLKQAESKVINNNCITFCYAGTFGISQDLIDLIRFYEKIQLENKKLILIGEGAEKQRIFDYIQGNKLKNVEVTNAVEQNELEKIYQKVDICITKLRNNNYFSQFMPSKVFNIMINKKPILFLGPDGEVCELINKAKCGFYLTKTNTQENADDFINIVRGYKDLIELKEDLNLMGYQGFNYCVDHFSRQQLADKYLGIIRKTVVDKTRER